MYLNCHSCYSLNYGVMEVKDLLNDAAQRMLANGVNRY